MIHSIKVGNTTEHIGVYNYNQYWRVNLPGESSDVHLPIYSITDNRDNSNGITDPFTDHTHTSLVFNNDGHGTALQVAHIGESEIFGSSIVRIGAHTGVPMEVGSGTYTQGINSHILVASSHDGGVKGINIDSTIIRGYAGQADYGMTLTDLNNEFSSGAVSEAWRIGTSETSLKIESHSDIIITADSSISSAHPNLLLSSEGASLRYGTSKIVCDQDYHVTLSATIINLGTTDRINSLLSPLGKIAFGRQCSNFYNNYRSKATNVFAVWNAYGHLSNQSDVANTYFVVGCGTSSSPKNAIRITSTKFYAANAVTAPGEGVAECFEWLDGNPDNEDRIGKFVTLVGEKIRFASPEDDYILGAIDPKPFAVGGAGDEWKDKYMKDVFGRQIFEKVFIPKEVDEDGNVLWEDHYEDADIINPEFNPSLTYVDRQDRQEYDAITSKGKIVMIDDGTCQVDGYATVGENGVATRSDTNIAVRVMKRIDDTHIYVYIDHVFSPKNC